MATLKQLRRRIRSAKSIQQITRAMKLVAAARLLRSQERVLQARPYADKMRELIANLGAAGDMPEHPLLKRRPIKRKGVIVFTAERGLCGSYNTNIIRTSAEYIAKCEAPPLLVAVGKKGRMFFAKRGYEIADSFEIPTTGPTLAHANEITRLAQELFTSENVDAVSLVYSKFYSAIRQEPQIVQLFPIEPPTVALADQVEAFQKVYSFEPKPEELLENLLPRYARTLVLQALLESAASEHGARMTAMSSATDNAGEMIRSLTLDMNRSRQAAITKEILEVVGGAEALKG